MKKVKNKSDVKGKESIQSMRFNRILEQNRDALQEIKELKGAISMLNETIYEDRKVLQRFVQVFLSDTKAFIDPKLGIDGGRSAGKKK